MTTSRGDLTLQARLLASFLAVAVVAIGVYAGLTLWSARGQVNDLVQRQRQATVTSVVQTLADSYREAGSWTGADLRPARVVAAGAGGRLEVRDVRGALVSQGRGFGQGPPAALRTAFGVATVRQVVVGGTTVGTASIRFPKDALPPAEHQLRDALVHTALLGAAIAAAVALLVGLAVTHTLTRPLRRLIDAVCRLGRGERSARANLRAPGELGELAAAVDAMAAALEREDELRRALTADVAHELRTPVTILGAHLEAMLDGVAEPTPEHIGSLAEEVQRLGRLIEDLETLSSAEAAGLHLERRPVDLAAVVRSTADLLAPRFDAAQVGLDVRGAQRAPVAGDERRLGQIVRNLLGNALAFTPPGGRVRVDLAPHDGLVRLEVSDTGTGIPADELPHVFERFWRGSGSAGTAGSGIGLAVVQELVHAHGGTVAAASDGGDGARFTVELPRS